MAARSHPFGVEDRLLPGAVAFERAFLADRVGALENPVLPRGQPGKYFRFHRFRSGEAQIGFEAGETVRRKARALFEEDAHFVVPIDVVEREGDEAELLGAPASSLLPLSALAASRSAGSARKRDASRVSPFDIG